MVARSGPSTFTGVGIYARWAMGQVRDNYSIYGTVALWGRVLEFTGGPRGYMGEFGYPYELHIGAGLANGNRWLAESLHQNYPGVWIFQGADDRLY